LESVKAWVVGVRVSLIIKGDLESTLQESLRTRV